MPWAAIHGERAAHAGRLRSWTLHHDGHTALRNPDTCSVGHVLIQALSRCGQAMTIGIEQQYFPALPAPHPYVPGIMETILSSPFIHPGPISTGVMGYVQQVGHFSVG